MNSEQIRLKYREKHPEWSDDQIWAAVSIELNAENVIQSEGEEINPNDPDIIKQIIIGARNWLSEVLPKVFAKVATFFDNLITNIGQWVSKGLVFIVDAIARLLGKE